MNLWLNCIKGLKEKGYDLHNSDKYLSHIEYPMCNFKGVIPKDVSPLITIYELIELLVEYGNEHVINKGKCLIYTKDYESVSWIEEIGSHKIPLDIDIEVNIMPDKNTQIDINLTQGLLTCNINLLEEGIYEGLITTDTSYKEVNSKSVIIWETDFDSVLNKGIYNILKKYFDVVNTIGICKNDFECSNIKDISVVIKITTFNYLTRTLSIKNYCLGNHEYEDILIDDLNMYLFNKYNETSKV